MTKRCLRVCGRLWRVKLASRTVHGIARRLFVAAVARFGSADQESSPRRFEQIIGNSPALEAALEQVERVAPTDSTVLIQGETGTGKELIARAIHNISSRCGRPYIKLN